MISLLENLNFVLFVYSKNSVAISEKVHGPVLKEKYLLKLWNYFTLLNCIGAFVRRWGPWFVVWCFALVRLICVPVNLHNVLMLTDKGHWPLFLDSPHFKHMTCHEQCFSWNTVATQATEISMWDCWSFCCCFSGSFGSLSKYSQLQSFLQVFLWYMFIWNGWIGYIHSFSWESLLVILVVSIFFCHHS